jgi:hypothetical protein
MVLDAFVAGDAVALGDVQRALAEDDAIGRIHALQDRLHFALAAAVDHRVDVLRNPVADEYRALVAERERTRLGHAVGPDLDLEAGRHLESVDRQVLGRAAGQVRRERVQR